jgi:hypothetical protein
LQEVGLEAVCGEKCLIGAATHCIVLTPQILKSVSALTTTIGWRKVTDTILELFASHLHVSTLSRAHHRKIRIVAK